jgi:hypothetical protein
MIHSADCACAQPLTRAPRHAKPALAFACRFSYQQRRALDRARSTDLTLGCGRLLTRSNSGSHYCIGRAIKRQKSRPVQNTQFTVASTPQLRQYAQNSHAEQGPTTAGVQAHEQMARRSHSVVVPTGAARRVRGVARPLSCADRTSDYNVLGFQERGTHGFTGQRLFSRVAKLACKQQNVDRSMHGYTAHHERQRLKALNRELNDRIAIAYRRLLPDTHKRAWSGLLSGRLT